MTGTGSGGEVPVLLLIFNRPDLTRVVFESIRSAAPPALYVAGDGPRAGRAGETEKCEQARSIATAVDWDCRVETLFRDDNLGAGQGVVAALDWFFENEEAGIVLEDDCVPGPSFYRFCRELLSYYEAEARVMHVSGNNFQYGRKRGRASYYFSKYTHSWGWATWRRAWRCFDFGLIPEGERHHVWDAAWQLSVERTGGLAVLPNANLVTNIGFGPEATHTLTTERFAHLPAEEIQFPLRHPASMVVDRKADALTYYANFRNIRDLRMLRFYQIVDFCRLLPSRTRKLALKARALRQGRSAHSAG
ncbi:MAG TPA: hypothetical protein VLY63_11375, partial [Anaerolineae bacterium]|nr:hypothetical protein [Anaerolineae bacterium]